DQSFADRISNETCAGASGRHRKTSVGRCANDEACLLLTFRKRDANGLDLINRRVGRIKLPRQIIKARVAAGLLDFPFLRRSHFTRLKLTPDPNVAQASNPWGGWASRPAFRMSRQAGSPPAPQPRWLCYNRSICALSDIVS